MIISSPKTLCLLSALCLAAASLIFSGSAQAVTVTPAVVNSTTTSADSFRVGQFLQVNSTAVTAGSTQTIILEGADGYKVTIESDRTGEGYVVFSLPPHFAWSAKAFTAAAIKLTLLNIGSANISVDAPMTPSGADLNEFLALGMDKMAAQCESTLKALASVDTSKVSLDDLKAALESDKEAFTAIAAQARQGSVSMGSGPNVMTMDSGQIGSTARLLYSQMMGLLEEGGYDTGGMSVSDSTQWPNWWDQTWLLLGNAEGANDKIINDITNVQSAKGLVAGIASAIGEENPLGEVSAYAPVVLPLLKWSNEQYHYSLNSIMAFMEGDLTRKELDSMKSRLDHMETVTDIIADSLTDLDDTVRDLLGLDTWLQKQQAAIANLRTWHEAMTGDDGGGDDDEDKGDCPQWLTQPRYWYIKAAFYLKQNYGGITDMEETAGVIFNCGDNGGGTVDLTQSNKSLYRGGRFWVSGNTVHFSYERKWAFSTVPCCWKGDWWDTYSYSGSWDGNKTLSGSWTKEHPQGHSCKTSGGQCKSYSTTHTDGWSAEAVR